MTDTARDNLDQAASFRPRLAPTPDDYAAIVVKKDMKISQLEQELETERRENSRLRARLEVEDSLKKESQ